MHCDMQDTSVMPVERHINKFDEEVYIHKYDIYDYKRPNRIRRKDFDYKRPNRIRLPKFDGEFHVRKYLDWGFYRSKGLPWSCGSSFCEVDGRS